MDILTGNELLSGAAVYLSADGKWVEELQQARLFRQGRTRGPRSRARRHQEDRTHCFP